ncbi:beta-glucosidase 40 [Phtheirospermum japonicum]|uniref:Beta-glucosidase 40 n=1 Tax=Phtheirospermum japonicum TaxID=374723 RepID=A0A830CWZ6_9LAMI|nr:beta-glucosidase 40 [Phtheirospermum japonicum]
MKDMGMDAYRFSISWSRIYPNGTGEINQDGIDHYNNLINAFLAQGIEPYVTLFHWDLPQSLEDRYTGWLSPQSINDFATYAETCFKEFGDRVKHWITFNEPHTISVQGYDVGLQAPGRCLILLRLFCRAGNSATKPYIVAHIFLLSHATVVDIYKKKYKVTKTMRINRDIIGFLLVRTGNKLTDIQAAQRAIDFNLGWFIESLIVGDYPKSMRDRISSRLPSFSPAQSAQVKGSFDFIGINHYTTWFANENKMNIIGVLLSDALADSGTLTLRMLRFVFRVIYFCLFVVLLVILLLMPDTSLGIRMESLMII